MKPKENTVYVYFIHLADIAEKSINITCYLFYFIIILFYNKIIYIYYKIIYFIII